MLAIGRPLTIVIVGASLGLSWNAIVLQSHWGGLGGDGLGLPLGSNALIRNGDEEISVDIAAERFAHGHLFLDVRPWVFYQMGHVPGALSLPEDDFDRDFHRLEPALRSAMEIVVYCGGFGCDGSNLVARKLKEHKIQAAIMPGGWADWTEARHPTRQGDAP